MIRRTIVTLWDATKEFMKLHPEHVAQGNSMDFLSDDGGKEYNHCHCTFFSPNLLVLFRRS